MAVARIRPLIAQPNRLSHRLVFRPEGNVAGVDATRATEFEQLPTDLTVVTAAQRKGELVAYSAGESTALREAKVVRIGRKPAAHEGSQVKQAVLIIGLGLRHS
jgi:hypothetical protein